MTDHQIAMLWMRGRLSFLERLCVQSFLDRGHHVVLYSYDEIGGVPEGVERRDATEILPETDFLVHARTGSPAPHADRFRYRLLAQEERLIWADTDAYCRQPFRPVEGHLYGWESEHHVNVGVLALPDDSPTLHGLLEATADEFVIPEWEKPAVRQAMIEARDRGAPIPASEQTWGIWGPLALTYLLKKTGEMPRALPQVALYPYSFAKRRRLLLPGRDHAGHITDETQSIHLYGRRLRKRMAEADRGLPHPDSLMGALLQQHRIDPCDWPLADCPDPDRDHPFARTYRDAARGGAQYPAAALTATAPESAERPDQKIRPLDTVVAVTTMRNEGAFILDWVAYHRSIGVTHFLVYTNDCDDPTTQILDALSERGLVTRVENPGGPEDRPQRSALAAAAGHALVHDADAVVVFDVDEYINIHVGDGTLADLFAWAGDPDMISMTWRVFGSGGHAAYEDAPVPLRFPRAAPHNVPKPHQNWGIKTIQRRGAPFVELGIHRPLVPTGAMPRWVNGSGAPMPERYLSEGWRSGRDCVGYDLVTLNHYAVRTPDSFLVKRDRGRPNHVARRMGADYWNIYNRNDQEDRTIESRWARAAPLRDVFAQDPVLGPLHAASVRWHRQRIADLSSAPLEAALLSRLSADPLSRDVAETGLPERTPVPPTRIDLSDADVPKPAAEDAPLPIPIRTDPPLMGEAAAGAFRDLLVRTQSLSGRLVLPATPPASDRITIVTSMKNEAPFILEWIAYHLSIGVTRFLVYTNDCDDQTDPILDRLSMLGLVTRVDNPFNRDAGQKPQRGALNDAATRPEVTGADWVGVIDVDEFVNIHTGDGTFAALLDAARHPNVISMTWRMFGNRGVHRYEDAWQTETFTACAPELLPKPRLGWGFKSFYRPDGPYSKIGVHRPLDLDPHRASDVRWVNGSGFRMPDRVIRKAEWFSRKDTIGYDLVTLNHYVLRSAESFLVKRQRGRINHVDQDQGLAYWASRNYATETDARIHTRLPRARERFADLLADAELARLHAEAVAWHRSRIDALLSEPDYRALYDAITQPGLPDAIWRDQPAEKAETPSLEAAE